MIYHSENLKWCIVTVLLASNNGGKLARYRRIVENASLPIRLTTPAECGIESIDVEKGVVQHNARYVKSTSHRRPFRVIYREPYPTRIKAREREKYLKSYKGSKEKLTMIDSILAPSSNG